MILEEAPSNPKDETALRIEPGRLRELVEKADGALAPTEGRPLREADDD